MYVCTWKLDEVLTAERAEPNKVVAKRIFYYENKELEEKRENIAQDYYCL